MRILLTGGTGQLGGALRSCLSGLGEVAAPSRAELDLTSPEAIRTWMRNFRPSLVVNAAAFTAVDDAEENPALAQAINTQAPALLAEETKRAGGAILHYSTDYVFDGEKDEPYREDDWPRPLSVYGETKRAGEVKLIKVGAPYLIIRVCWLYSMGRSNFLTTVLRLGREREVLSMVDDQHGAPTPAGVVADATAQIIAQAKGNVPRFLRKSGGLLHVTCRDHTTWFGFAQAILEEARRLGMPLAVREVRPVATADYPRPAKRPANSRLDLRRLHSRYGVETPHWRDALRAVMACRGHEL